MPEEGKKSIDLRKEEWIAKLKKEGRLRDPTESHSISFKTMQLKIRRDILAFIGGGKSINEIKEAFGLNDMDAKIHLGMLENALYIERSEQDGVDHYFLTIFGEEHLENVEKIR
ncbi:MAG: ArsR family transcriptional regulator [Halobacteriota archaeon]|nr:ArsR family transcriptional regulator [Halobacteriota archaeon]